LFDEAQLLERRETATMVREISVETNVVNINDAVSRTLAGFQHRNDTISAPTSCKVRTRLTPSGPSKAGSMWYRESVPVSNGFDTYFTFQISDHSKECTLHKDQYFSLIDHRTCNVHGGDGFAFVIQNDPNGTFALGGNGEQMGFGGIKNSLAIAFDMFSNPGVGMDQLGVDHVSVQSKGNAANSGNDDGLLGVPKAYDLADGKVHLVRIVYWGELLPQYFDKLVASDSLLPYLKDNGEQKRVGTLLVYLDQGVESDTPLLAIPINLSVLLDMPVDKALVGFTGSTGRFFEKHDIISWYWCDQEPCEKAVQADFNYHHSSNFSISSLRKFSPGPGFGGSDGSEGFPTRNQSPDSAAWTEPLQHFSTGRAHGLSEDGASQVPPQTLYR
jgi:hypothetical protein